MPTFLLEAVLFSAHVAFITSEGKCEIKITVPIRTGYPAFMMVQVSQKFPSLCLFLWPAEHNRLMLAVLLTHPIIMCPSFPLSSQPKPSTMPFHGYSLEALLALELVRIHSFPY